MSKSAVPRDRLSERGAGRRPRIFLGAIMSILTLCFVLLGVRLFSIQILDHEIFLARGRRMWGGTDDLSAFRGDIRTRDQVLLARSILSYEIGVDPSLVSDEERLVRVVRTACDQLGYPPQTRRERLERVLRGRRSGCRYVRLGRAVDAPLAEKIVEAVAARLPRKQLRAIRRIPSSRRVYPHGDFLAQVIGVVDPDGRGIEGVELSMNDFLTQRHGKRRIVKDARQRLRIYYPENSDVSPIHGYNVILTIDSRLQGILAQELEKGVAKQKAAAGLGVAMDCRSGDVLAMASWPDYVPDEYHKYPEEERDRRRKNRVIENAYEPGSVIKPFIASWALHKGVSRRDEVVWGGGKRHRFRLGRSARTVSDVSDHGPLTLEGAVVYSSNIAMSHLGLKLGRDRIMEAQDQFGFVRRSGILLPGEVVGRRQSVERWSELYTSVSAAFGYEMMVTPIQLCVAFAALVNGGYLYKPRIVERVERDGKVLVNPTELVGRPIDEKTSRDMREILLRVVTDGTGRYLRLDGFPFGGKTGTADMDPGYSKEDYLASFEAFAPYENPRIVVLVMIEKPRAGSIYGSTVSGPVVARVLRRYFRVEADVAIASLRQ